MRPNGSVLIMHLRLNLSAVLGVVVKKIDIQFLANFGYSKCFCPKNEDETPICMKISGDFLFWIAKRCIGHDQQNIISEVPLKAQDGEKWRMKFEDRITTPNALFLHNFYFCHYA